MAKAIFHTWYAE